jgi:hypothetical protein
MERDLYALIDPKQPLPCSLGVVARQSRLDALARIEQERKERTLWFEQSFVSDDADSTLKEVLSALLRTRAIEPPRASVPLPVAWAMATAMEWIWRAFSRQGEPPITRPMLRLIGMPFTVDIGKARRELLPTCGVEGTRTRGHAAHLSPGPSERQRQNRQRR